MTGDVSSNSAPCSLVIDSCGKLLRPLQGVDVLQQHTEKENGLRRFATASGSGAGVLTCPMEEFNKTFRVFLLRHILIEDTFTF